MAKVTAKVFQGPTQVLDNVNTVGDVKRLMNVPTHVATVNDGGAVEDGYQLEDFNLVYLAPSIKGGC